MSKVGMGEEREKRERADIILKCSLLPRPHPAAMESWAGPGHETIYNRNKDTITVFATNRVTVT